MYLIKILAFIVTYTLIASAFNIKDYVVFHAIAYDQAHKDSLIILRKFTCDKATRYLTVNSQTFATSILACESSNIHPISPDSLQTIFASTPYIKAIKQSEHSDDSIQDAGLRHMLTSRQGITLTIDLCPSHRPLDKLVFTQLINELGHVEHPVPVAVSITGKWMKEYPGDLRWLDSLTKSGALSITWINHSYNHFYKKELPLTTNFLLEPGTDINSEVLKVEIALLEQGIVPSVFFRFPGLISNRQIFLKIVALGLIPVGSDAWLAKGQQPSNGSIVLIHANGNDPLGVKDFITLLNSKKDLILSKQWELFDLRESLIDTESVAK